MHLARLSLKSSHQVAVGCFVVRGQGDGSGGEKGEIVPLLQLLPYQTSVGKASLGGMGQTKDEPNQGGRGVALPSTMLATLHRVDGRRLSH